MSSKFITKVLMVLMVAAAMLPTSVAAQDGRKAKKEVKPDYPALAREAHVVPQNGRIGPSETGRPHVTRHPLAFPRCARGPG